MESSEAWLSKVLLLGGAPGYFLQLIPSCATCVVKEWAARLEGRLSDPFRRQRG